MDFKKKPFQVICKQKGQAYPETGLPRLFNSVIIYLCMFVNITLLSSSLHSTLKGILWCL